MPRLITSPQEVANAAIATGDGCGPAATTLALPSRIRDVVALAACMKGSARKPGRRIHDALQEGILSFKIKALSPAKRHWEFRPASAAVRCR
jgi:hypothetical protein